MILPKLSYKKSITANEMVLLFRQFATLITAGIPLIKTCELLENSQDNPRLQALITLVKRDILTGQHLYESLQHYPRYFSELTCRLIQMGEHTGKLDTMLTLVADFQEKQQRLKRQIQQALFYPCLIAITGIAVTLGLLLFVIPQFADMFHTAHDKLPWITRSIFYLSELTCTLSHSAIELFGTLGLFLIGYPRWKQWKQDRNRRTTQTPQHVKRIALRLPFLGPLLKKMVAAQFARNLAITLTAGIALIEALKLSASACGDKEFARLTIHVRQQLQTGLTLHHALATQSYFPRLMIQLIKTGEESGMLEHMLLKVADFLEAELQHFFHQLHQLLEPLILIGLGVLIGGLVIGMYLPIFKLGSLL